MDTYVRRFIRPSLARFGAGVPMGLAMAVQPPLIRTGAAASAATAALFIYNLWRTLDAGPRLSGWAGLGRAPIRSAVTGGTS